MYLKMIITQVGPLTIHLSRKAIKHLYIRITPPDGLVMVSAPKSMSDAVITQIVTERLSWIENKQRILQNHPKPLDSYSVTKEDAYLWGKKYPLIVTECLSKPKAVLQDESIVLHLPSDASFNQHLLVMDEFYRSALKNQIAALLLTWQEKMGISVNEWGVKRMKTRWGSCNITAKRIWLNLELAKRPIECLEYVVVHELVHLFERNHNQRFKAYMDQFLPDWRERHKLLNTIAPLG